MKKIQIVYKNRIMFSISLRSEADMLTMKQSSRKTAIPLQICKKKKKISLFHTNKLEPFIIQRTMVGKGNSAQTTEDAQPNTNQNVCS